MKSPYQFKITKKMDGIIHYEIIGPSAATTRGRRRGTVREVTKHYKKSLDRLNFIAEDCIAEAAALKNCWGNTRPQPSK